MCDINPACSNCGTLAEDWFRTYVDNPPPPRRWKITWGYGTKAYILQYLATHGINPSNFREACLSRHAAHFQRNLLAGKRWRFNPLPRVPAGQRLAFWHDISAQFRELVEFIAGTWAVEYGVVREVAPGLWVWAGGIIGADMDSVVRMMMDREGEGERSGVADSLVQGLGELDLNNTRD